MLNSVNRARYRLRLAAHNGAVTTLSAGLFLVGAGFAIAAGWIFLAREWGTLEATGAFAIAFVLLSGLVLLARRPAPPPREQAVPPPPPPRPDKASSAAILLQAFVLGQRLAEQSQRPPRH